MKLKCRWTGLHSVIREREKEEKRKSEVKNSYNF